MKRGTLLLIGFLAVSFFATGEDSVPLTATGKLVEESTADSLPISNERFYQIMDKMLEDKLQQVDTIYSELKMTSYFQQLRQGFIEKLKHLNFVKTFGATIKQHGLKLGSLLVLGEVFTSAVFPAFLLSLGSPLASIIAGVSVAIPSPLYLMPSYFYFLNVQEKAKLVKELSLTKSDFASRMKLKKEILNLAQGDVLVTKIAQQVGEDQELNLVKKNLVQRLKGYMGETSSPKGYLDLKTLEKLFRKNLKDNTLLKAIKKASHGNDDIYGMLLLEYLRKDPASWEDVEKYMSEQHVKWLALKHPTSRLAYARNLHQIGEQLKLIDYRITQLKEQYAHLNNLLGTMPGSQGPIAKEMLATQGALSKLQDLAKQFKVFEIEYLGQIKSHPADAVLQITDFSGGKKQWQDLINSYQQIVDSALKIGDSKACLQVIFESLVTN